MFFSTFIIHEHRPSWYKKTQKKEMKQSSRLFIYIMCMIVCLLCGCKGKQKPESDTTVTKTKPTPVEVTPKSVETRGIIGEGSSMNLMQLIEYDGDTLDIVTANQMVMGGLIVGDAVDVVYSLIGDNLVAQTAVNLTALQHLWSQHVGGGEKKSLEIDDKGLATTYNMSIQYDRWAVRNGLLMLSTPKKIGDEKPANVDTFQIMMLTEDSLVLMSNSIAFSTAFYRDN